MTVKTIRQKLHHFLEMADDKKVRAMYLMMEEAVERTTVAYSPELQQELTRRHSDYKTGKTGTFTAAESKKRVKALLKTGGK